MGKNKGRPVVRQPEQPKAQPPADAASKLRLALEFHQRGLLGRADALYREILETAPNHFDALHLLGVIEAQRGHNEAAARLIGRAVEIYPGSAPAHSNLGNALRALGRPGDALACYDRALAIKPDYAEALYNRGIALQDLMQPEDALASYERALTFKPAYAEALMNRGIVLQGLKRFGDALSSYDRALAIQPAYAEALSNRGNTLRDLERPADALASYDRALDLRSDYVEALANRAVVLHDLERPEDALVSCDRALAIQPDHVEALVSRGRVLSDLMRPEDALASCERALDINPDHARAHLYRGNVLHQLERMDEALASYQRASAIESDYMEALNNCGRVLQELGRYEEAVTAFERLLAIEPHYDYAPGRLLSSQMHCCAWEERDSSARLLTDEVRNGRRAATPFSFLSVSDSAGDQLQCSRIHVNDLFPASAQPVWTGQRYSHDRIRVAYLSAEFREHATSYLIAGLIELHDRRRFEVFGVSAGTAVVSNTRTRLQRAFNHFIDIAAIKSDAEVASMLRDREIDVLVDLNGHVGRPRTGILALRPAPIQVNYLGYPGTMGADYVDYILADQFVIPPEHHAYYTEKVVYLPDTYQVNDSRRVTAEQTPGRAEAGLPDTAFVFCCFNNNYKISPAVFDVWMRLLLQVDDSVLWLLQDNATAVRNLRREAARRGVAAERLIFAPRMGLDLHLARHRLADLFLDTLPVNAHTTASDALWTGLPILTCQGNTFAGRVAASLLNAIGMADLVTHSAEEYEARALRLATSPGLLPDLKARLSANRSTHPLFNTDRFRRHIEAAYIAMWERYQRGEPPESFAVPCIE